MYAILNILMCAMYVNPVRGKFAFDVCIVFLNVTKNVLQDHFGCFFRQMNISSQWEFYIEHIVLQFKNMLVAVNVV